MAKRIPSLDSDSSDELLMSAIRQKNTYAFELLFKRYKTAIIAYALRMVQDEQKAQDLAQEIFLRILKKRDSYNPGKKFSSWMYRIATNACIDEIRRSKFSAKMDEEQMKNVPADAAAGPVMQTEMNEKERLVKSAIKGLSPEHRTIIILHQYQGFTYEEIGEIMEKGVNWVKWHMKLAYDELAKKLKAYF